MSDFFRVSIPPEIRRATTKALARLAHEAEDGDDDVLLMQVAAETERRGSAALAMFREWYLVLWDERMKGTKMRDAGLFPGES